jgi:hypothetical protein
MRKQFSLERNTAVINFSSNYCETSEKLLNSSGFNKVLVKYIDRIKDKETPIYIYLKESLGQKYIIRNITDLFKLLLVLDTEDVKKYDVMYLKLLSNKQLVIEFIEGFYNFWRRLERYSIVYNKYYGEGIQKTNFIEANNKFTNLVIQTYRTIIEKLHGTNQRVYRQLTAGANAGLILNRITWDIPEIYKGLAYIPFIETILLHPPFITYPKRNTRSGYFTEVSENPLSNVILDSEQWFCYPAKVGKLLGYIFFHKDFMSQGITLCNLFELAPLDECKGVKPDLIYVFGYADEESKTVFHYDQFNDVMVGYASYSEDYDYFGYMKKMILTLHNVRMIEKGYLPIHGAMVNIIMNDGKQANVVIIGDSGAGKSESLEALRVIGDDYIKDMKVIFDDMGTFALEDGEIKAYGTEIGAFIRLDDLDIGYAYREIDRSVFMNPDKVNARVVIPVSTYPDIIAGHHIDMVFYANNYEDGTEIEWFNKKEEAIQVFTKGARMAKGTTTEKGLVESFFANPFGPYQRQEQTEVLIDLYFDHLFKNNIHVGQIRTRLALDGYEHTGPQKAAIKLFEFIQKEV